MSVVRNSKQLEGTTIRKLDLFQSSGEGRETPTLLGALEWAILNLEFRPMDELYKPCDSER
jgi:hypothetical protein